jgi:hypothetical protein
MFKTEERVIGASTYMVSQLGAIAGRAAFLRLVKALGPALGGLVSAGGKLRGDIDFGDLISRVQLSEGDLSYFCDLFAQKTFVKLEDGKMPRLDNVFDAHFAGKYMDLVQWLAFCVKVNFADFFGDLGQSGPAPPSKPAVTAPS